MAGQAPEYQQRTVASGGGGPALLQNAPNTDAGLSDALQRTGAQLGQLGQQIHANRVETDGQTATKTASEFAVWSAEQVNALERAPAEELPAAVQKYREEAQKFREKAIGNLRTREGAQYQGRLLDSYDAHATERIGQITAFTADQTKLQGLDATTSNNAAAVEKAPELFGTTLAQTLAGIDQSGLTVEARAKLAVHARDTLALSATNGLMAKDIQGAARELGPDGGKLAATRELDPRLREQLFQRATVEAQHARVAQIASPIVAAMSRDTRQGTAALLALEADKSVSDEDKLAARDAVRTQTNLLQDERARQYGEQIAGISRRMEAKTATAADLASIVGIYRKSGLTEAQLSSLTTRYEGMVMERAKSQAAQADLANLLVPGQPISPHNSEQIKAFNLAYEARVAGLPPMDPQRHAVALGLASQFQWIPHSEIDALTSMARSPNAKSVLLAAQMFGSLKQQAPLAVAQLDDQTRLFLGEISKDVEHGATPAEAFATNRALMFDVPQGVQDMRGKAFKEGGDHSPLASQLSVLSGFAERDFASGIGPWRTDAPVNTAMLDAFNQLTEKNFKTSGKLEASRADAWNTLKRGYGVTKVNGRDELMPMPIESFGVKPEEVRTDVVEALKDRPDIKPEDVTLAPTGTTLRQMYNMLNGKPVMPEYALLDKNGRRILKDGLPQNYTLPDPALLRQKFYDSQNKAEAEGQMLINQARDYRKLLEEVNADPNSFLTIGP